MKKMAICLYCNKNFLPLEKWNRRCSDCKQKLKKLYENKSVFIGKRLPAAVLETKDGRKIFIDKFGIEIKNHRYDFKNDPRGWKTTGAHSKTKVII